MREIVSHKVNGLNEALTITAVDEPGPGGANHEYLIQFDTFDEDGHYLPEEVEIEFQKGPIREAGMNGISNEALLAIVADRLQGFIDDSQVSIFRGMLIGEDLIDFVQFQIVTLLVSDAKCKLSFFPSHRHRSVYSRSTA